MHLRAAEEKLAHGDIIAAIANIDKGLEFKPDFFPLLKLKQQVNAETRRTYFLIVLCAFVYLWCVVSLILNTVCNNYCNFNMYIP